VGANSSLYPGYIGLVAAIIELLLTPRRDSCSWPCSQGLALWGSIIAIQLLFQAIHAITGTALAAMLASLKCFSGYFDNPRLQGQTTACTSDLPVAGSTSSHAAEQRSCPSDFLPSRSGTAASDIEAPRDRLFLDRRSESVP
jgi:hypothetical protein